MICPKCGHEQAGAEVCESCGIYFDKYRLMQERMQNQQHVHAAVAERKGGSGISMVAVVAVVAAVGIGFMLLRGNGKARNTHPAAAVTKTSKTQPAPTPDSGDIATQLATSYRPRNKIEAARNRVRRDTVGCTWLGFHCYSRLLVHHQRTRGQICSQ